MTRAVGKVLVIVGPTAVGKSEAAVGVAKALGACEIVSADSMQVYRQMDIGTAKPSKTLTAAVPHHLIDIVEPNEDFSVAKFQKLARGEIERIHARESLPILVGGSGLYIRAVIDPLDFPAAEPGSPFRKELETLAQNDPPGLIEKLRLVDPAGFDSIDKHNTRRVIRAIEIATHGEGTFEERARRWRRREAVYEVLGICLTLKRETLYSEIEARADKMVADGLEDETRSLLRRGPLSTTAAQALGYKEMIKYFNGEINRDEAVALIKMRTRRFAKRQMTWFKADSRFSWLEVDGLSTAEKTQAIMELVNARDFIVS